MAPNDTSAANPSVAADRGPAPAKRGRGRPVGDHDAKRSELVRAAIQVIAQEGYAGASLRKVAAQAGCTTGAVTYYFENKEGMVAAIAEYLWDKWDSMRGGPGEHDVGLKTFLTWSSSEDTAEWMANMEIQTHARHVPAFSELYQERYKAYRKALTKSLAESQKRGLVRRDVPADILSEQICAIADGWMLAIPHDPRRFTPKRIDALVDATMALIRGPDSSGA